MSTPRALHIISLNHVNATAVERIDMNLSVVDWFHLEAYARFSLGVVGWVNISTCNRIEVLLDAPSGVNIKLLVQKWTRLAKHPIDKDKFQIISGNFEVIQYLLELSTGLRSMILGDDQILKQIKQAFEASRSTETGLSTLIERAYQCMMRCHKEITGSTNFKNNGRSLAYFALKKIDSFIHENGNASFPNILLIGAGNMAGQVIKYLPKFKFGEVYITNRTISKAEILTKGTNIHVVHTDQLKGINPDIIISCSEHGYELVKNYYHPRFLVDFSLRSTTIVPNGFELLDLETMQCALAKNDEIRRSSVIDVRQIIKSNCSLFNEWAVSWEARQAEKT